MATSTIKLINSDAYNNMSYIFSALTDGRIVLGFNWLNAPTNAISQIVFSHDYIRVDTVGGGSKQVSLT